MKGIRDIRQRIKAVKSTAQITRAMQLVSASKMKKAQDNALTNRPYAVLLEEIMVALSDRLDQVENPFLVQRAVKTRGVLAISTDRGLCGPLNSNLCRLITKLEGDIQFISLGKKATQFLSRGNYNLVADFELPDRVTFNDVNTVLEYLMGRYLDGEIDTIEVLYPAYVNTLLQEPILQKLAPLVDMHEALDKLRRRFGSVESSLPKDERVMLFEPSKSLMVNALPTFFLKHELYHCILESRASEHSARMVAMKTATDNAKNLIEDLNLEYNKARQAGITQEILEISASMIAAGE